MAQLRQDYLEYVKQNAEVLVIGPEGAEQFRRYWQEHDLPFPGLPDPKHTVLKRYGQEINLFKFGRMPAQVIIDQDGLARYIHYGKSMADIPSTSEMMDVLAAINTKEAV